MCGFAARPCFFMSPSFPPRRIESPSSFSPLRFCGCPNWASGARFCWLSITFNDERFTQCRCRVFSLFGLVIPFPLLSQTCSLSPFCLFPMRGHKARTWLSELDWQESKVSIFFFSFAPIFYLFVCLSYSLHLRTRDSQKPQRSGARFPPPPLFPPLLFLSSSPLFMTSRSLCLGVATGFHGHWNALRSPLLIAAKPHGRSFFPFFLFSFSHRIDFKLLCPPRLRPP